MKKKPKKYYSKFYPKKIFDLPLLLGVGILSIIGLIIIYDASVVEAFRRFSDKFFFVKQQAVWTMLGLFLALLLANIPYGIYKKLGSIFFILTLVLLFLVLVPGFSSRTLGARRWLVLGGLTIQPAELVKLSLVIYLAALFEKKQKFMHFLTVIGMVAGLIMLEPDMGTTIVVSVLAAGMYFISGAPLMGFVLASILALSSFVILIFSSEYRKARVITFFNPTSDPLGASYHIRQVLIALGSGGLFGLGIGKSRQKYEYIPAATTDSIFSIVAEELGFFGSLLIIGCFILIIIRMFKITLKCPERYGLLLAGGISIWLGAQILLNLSTMVALVPLTGVPLPFISYGGSSTLVNLAAIGILLNISKYANK
jgi:cell division protein FtsW